GGILGGLCGICCLLNNSADEGLRCVGAEEAALRMLANSSTLLSGWPGDDYSGPNVTFRLCKDGFCKTVSMRAWEGGDACVTTGVVGVCSPRGVCSRVIHTPRSNIYPNLLGNSRVDGPTDLEDPNLE
ncbi:Permease of oligopeptide ABC transporter, partial [Operophtera brumata]